MSSILRVHVKGFFNLLWLAIYKTPLDRRGRGQDPFKHLRQRAL